MKLKIFQSDHGDCLLLEGQAGGRMLCDGGMAESMREFGRGPLGRLRTAKKAIDYVYVSHIDEDHISGVLQLLEDELEWRVYLHHKQHGPPVKKPGFPRPPQINGILHNAFRDQVQGNDANVVDQLATVANIGLGSSNSRLIALGAELQQIALSVPQAIRVSHLTSAKVLNIPVNTLPGSTAAPKLLMVRANQPAFPVGSMQLTIVGPTADELEKLKKGWNAYLNDPGNADSLRKLRDDLDKARDNLGTAHISLAEWEKYKGVTVPNIASLMFMVEEGGKRLLLTGDSQQDIILKGLERTGFLTSGFCHVDALKVQHHGSEHNVDAAFCRKVSADHYVFCGNGANGNPELTVLRQIYNSRLGSNNVRALAPQANARPFTFWFSTTSEHQRKGSKERKAFVKIEQEVAQMVASSGGLLKSKFNTGAVMTLQI